MVLFAALMLAVAFSIITHKENTGATTHKNKAREHKVILLILLGLVIGVITGLLGAGGGFLIIPSLVLFLNLPMKRAIGTSLFIIAINSLFGFLFSLKQFEYNWTILLSFTALAIAGIFIGSRFADKIPGASLQKFFGWFVMVMAIYILIKELVL